MVLNWLALEFLTSNLSNTHAALFYDNNSSLGCKIKIRSVSYLTAGSLLRFLGMHIHATQASNHTPISIEGEDNYMANVVSCDFKEGKLFAANKNLTAYFQNHSPLPKGNS